LTLPTVSVVIPAYNSAAQLQLCLEALALNTSAPLEVIVVDDGSTDSSREIAARFGVTSLTTGGRRGPAYARNLGARAAVGDVLFFLDSDVCADRDSLDIVRANFSTDPELDALIGSYDSDPSSPDFLSQYRNLMHAFVHQTGAELASTFWSGCGAIRRAVFLEHSGFDESYGRPAIEDIELGYRLIRAKRKIVLDRTLQVKHLKRWTFWGLVKTDVLDRGIPWTELILRDGVMPNDLNVQLSQRISVALVFVLLALSGVMAVLWGGWFLVPIFAIVFALLVRYWIEFAIPARPRVAVAVILLSVAAIAVLAYRQGMYAVIPPLLLSPFLLLAKHRYSYATGGFRRKLFRAATAIYIVFSVVLALEYLPRHRLIFACFVTLATLGLMNSQFYLFLASKRGLPFMLAAIPFHLLYHFYSGLSFIAGLLCFLWKGAFRGKREPRIVEDNPLSKVPRPNARGASNPKRVTDAS
jgi:glycosyltransferase involved in cell wall biosynthesis